MDKTTAKRSFRLAAVVGAVLLLVCGLLGARDWWLSLSPPSREPDFRGRVVAQRGGQFLFESPAGGRCWVSTIKSTRIRTRKDEPTALAVGQTVSMWQTGPVRVSYPPGVDALWVIIEADEPKGQ